VTIPAITRTTAMIQRRVAAPLVKAIKLSMVVS
jgi:hypothetical protein